MGVFAYADGVIFAPIAYALRAMLKMLNGYFLLCAIWINLMVSEFVILVFKHDGKDERSADRMKFEGQILMAKNPIERLENITHILLCQSVEKVIHIFQHQRKCSSS